MAKTLLVQGPASAGKTALIRTLAGRHPDYHWHLVQLESSADPGPAQPLRIHTPDWAGLWYLRYRHSDIISTLPDLVLRISSEPGSSRAIIAFEAAPDPILRHALQYDLRVFVVPPIHDETVLFRTPDQSRQALRQILRDSSAFSTQVFALQTDPDDAAQLDDLPHPLGPFPTPGDTPELDQSQVARFLAGPLGIELAARVHLQPRFSAIADADLVVRNIAAGHAVSESDTCWQKLLALLSRLHKSTHPRPLIHACDLSDPHDPCFVRILHRMSEALCRL